VRYFLELAEPVSDLSVPWSGSMSGSVAGQGTLAVTVLSELLAAADQREADHRAQLETVIATAASCAAALERGQQRRMPWQAVSEPGEPMRRRWRWPWSR
jgi:hypothetical protein